MARAGPRTSAPTWCGAGAGTSAARPCSMSSRAGLPSGSTTPGPTSPSPSNRSRSATRCRPEVDERTPVTHGPTRSQPDGTITMQRILSCFTNCYGAAGVWTAVERIRAAGLDHLELALRGHNLGGLVIPESAVITEKADDATAQSFCDHLGRHGGKISGCNVGGADLRPRDGVELTLRRIRFAARWFSVPVVISGAGQPTDADERRTVIGHLKEMGDTAGEFGITVALEAHKGPTQNAEAMLALMDEVQHPQVRLN